MKWGGAGLTVLLVVVLVVSGWVSVARVGATGFNVWVMDGGFGASIPWTPEREGIAYWENDYATRPRFKWGFVWESGWGATGFHFALWPAALLSLLPTFAAWRADTKHLRRAREGACPACGYNRAGLAPGAVCPECGAAPSV